MPLDIRKHSVKKDNAITDVAIVSLDDALTAQTLSDIHNEIRQLVESGQRHILFTFKWVKHIDESGLATLVDILTKIYEYEGIVRLSDMESALFEEFRSRRLDKIFDIYSTELKALKSFET